jgi:hypothetical protein
VSFRYELEQRVAELKRIAREAYVASDHSLLGNFVHNPEADYDPWSVGGRPDVVRQTPLDGSPGDFEVLHFDWQKALRMTAESTEVPSLPDHILHSHHGGALEDWAWASFDNFIVSVDALAARFERYYDLDQSLELTLLVTRLDSERSLGLNWGDQNLDFDRVVRGELLNESPRTVYDRLQFAYVDWVQPVDGMIRAELWDGDGAATFQTDFIQPFAHAKARQMGCTKVLALAAQILHDGVLALQRDVTAIIDECITALVGDRPAGNADFSIASIVIGALGMLLPTGFSQAAGAASIGLGVASLFADEADVQEDGRWQIERPTLSAEAVYESGMTAEAAVIRSAADALTRMEDCLGAQDLNVGLALQDVVNSPEGFSSSDIRLDRPDIVEDDDAFGSRPYEPGSGRLETDLVVATITDVYRAGHTNLPGAAEQYDQAWAAIDESKIPTWLRSYFPTSRANFEYGRMILGGVFRNTRESLAGAGAALVQAAKDYDFTDTESAQALARFADVPGWQEYAGEQGWDLVDEPPAPAPVGGRAVYS